MASSLPQPIAVESLQRWSSTLVEEPSLSEDQASDDSPSKFPFSEAINDRMVLGMENIISISADALVNTTNERLNDRTGVSGLVFGAAGPELVTECMGLEQCHTGEAVITKGYKLNTSYIIHTVGPRFSVKYQTAAENALHGCYRRCLEVLKENGLETIVFPLVNTERKGYPKEPASHIALRTIRRFLEKYGSSIKTVALIMADEEDLKIYQRVMPLYFPRSKAEEQRVKSLLPEDVGNELGESVIQERGIRISAMPGVQNDDDIPVSRPAGSRTPTNGSFSGSAPVRPRISTKPSVIDHVPDEKQQDDFMAMADNPDDIRRKQDSKRPKDEIEREEAERRYAGYVQRAQEEDLSDVAAYNFIYPSGFDTMGRPVLVFVANKFPAATMDLGRLLLHIVSVMDKVVNRDYTMVYVHTGIADTNKPPFQWMREVYNTVFNRKYKKNLKRLFIVHPSWFVRTMIWFISPLVSQKFWVKLKQVTRLMELYDELNPQTLELPEDVLQYDKETNAADYTVDQEAQSRSPSAAQTDNDL